MTSVTAHKGQPAPLGSSPLEKGVNLALRAPKADKARLVVYLMDQAEPFAAFDLDPKDNKSGEVWHIALEGLSGPFDYSWFLEGTQKDPRDLPFDPARPLLDPFARNISSSPHWRGPKQTLPLRGRYLPKESFDWQGVKKPRIPREDLIIYEMHVRGFTIDPSSRSQHPGSYLGLEEKIHYLKELGINAVELLPIHEFDEMSFDKIDPVTKKPLCNYWGYWTVNFFCPMKRYASSKDSGAAVLEFKTLVRELHRAGIEVILDVVYNHTAEGEGKAHVFSFKGIDTTGYYLIDEKGKDQNFTGTGNTFACNTPQGQELILESLRYFAEEMQVDGFRFDLASILTRGEKGEPLKKPPVLEAIAQDPVLREVKLISEAWDAGGLYQVGQFPKWGPWSDWNGKYRDVMRRFIKGTDQTAGSFAQALSGSKEHLYEHYPLGPLHSINFITCHDGYTLRDLVSYQEKHNLRNAEENRDGNNENDSWNCGIEGPTRDPKINHQRERQMRNFHMALMLSLGIPMIHMGDEYGHSKQGNNNTWCQDNELNWFDWGRLEEEKGFYRFFRKMIEFRKKHSLFRRKKFFTSHDIVWLGPHHNPPDWSDKSRFVAATVHDPNDKKYLLYFAFNAGFALITVNLPTLKHHNRWVRIVDTSLPVPEDFSEPGHPLPHPTITMPPHSAILLVAE